MKANLQQKTQELQALQNIINFEYYENWQQIQAKKQLAQYGSRGRRFIFIGLNFKSLFLSN